MVAAEDTNSHLDLCKNRDGSVIATANRARDGFGRNLATASNVSSGRLVIVSKLVWWLDEEVVGISPLPGMDMADKRALRAVASDTAAPHI